MIKQLLLSACLLFAANSLFSQVSDNMVKHGEWDENTISKGGVKYNDIWGYVDGSGNEYAVLGSPDKVHFIDVTDPSTPTQVQEFIGGSSAVWRDFKSFGTYVYAVADEGQEGLLIFDMSALPAGSITQVNQINNTFSRAHNIFIDEPNAKLYVAGAGNGLLVYDLANTPAAPPLVGSSDLPGGGYVHDVYVRDNIAYCSHGYNGFYMWNYADPANPVFIDSRTTPGYNHSSWVTEDGNYALYAEEIPSGQPLGILDISDAGGNGITEEITFKFPLLDPNGDGSGPTNSTPHNPFIIGDYAYVSYYEDGVQVIDISDPTSPFLAAYYDTDPDNTNYNGTDRCWGVYPFFPSGNIIASDTEVGLIVISVDFNLAPKAAFDASNVNTCTGVTQFVDRSSNSPSTWLWDFGDGSSSTLQNPTHTYGTNGNYTVSLTVTNPNGSSTFLLDTPITINKALAPQANDSQVCNSGSTTLSATANGDIEWYDAFNNLLETGGTYVTPNLNSTTTYYVQNILTSPPANVGPVDNNIGGGNYFDNNQSLIFEVYAPMTLKSVWVDAEFAGIRNIRISGSNSVNITKQVIIPQGQSRVDIDVELEIGTYQIGGDELGLYRNNNGVSYPYEIPGVMGITNSTAGGNFYYFFYDWEVQAKPCKSPLEPVVVTVSGDAPSADFTTSPAGTTINFIDASLSASSWSWDFGDGNSSTLQNPTHTYATTGVYTVTLTVTNSCGGTDVTSNDITVDVASAIVDAGEWAAFQVNPNPNAGVFNLELAGDRAETLQVSIFDILGKQVLAKSYNFNSGQLSAVLNLGEVTNGTYILQVRADEKTTYKRIIVNK